MINNDTLPIPGFSRYSISKFGDIIEISSGRNIIPTTNGSNTLIVNIKGDSWKWVSPSVARLLLLTYKPCDLQLLKYASVRYTDANRSNIQIANLEWNFEPYTPTLLPGINISSNTYVTVPGFDRYEINSLGSVRRKKNCKLLSEGYISEQGYRMVRIVADSDKSTVISIHRLLALTFLEHPIDTDGLVINHKNGDKLDNRVDNIEWSTYSANIAHAYATGLRTENNLVYTRNIETGKCKTFISLGERGRFFDVSAGAIHSRLNTGKHNRPYKGYDIGYLSNIEANDVQISV